MTFEIALVLGILLVSLVLFITEVIRMDVVALIVLGALAVTGLVSSTEAFAGFSNSAVITVWAMFILSEGLTRTGIADIIGTQVMRLAGGKEIPRILVIMITAAVLSAFMNNIGVAALMLPVVVDLLCYLRLHTELSMRAKGLLMMRESGFFKKPGEETRAKLDELKFLEGSIGATGKLAIAPFLRMSQKDLWQFYMLSE